MARSLSVSDVIMKGYKMKRPEDIQLHKHVYQVFFEDKTSIRVMAFDKSDAKLMAKKLKPKTVIKKVEKIAD